MRRIGRSMQERLNPGAQSVATRRRSRSSSGVRTLFRLPSSTLLALATAGVSAYADAIRALLDDFESREEFLEDIPVADTVLALQALAARRGLAVPLHSRVLPA